MNRSSLSLSYASLSIFLSPRSILTSRSSCVPQPRLLGFAFWLLRCFCSNQGGVVTVLVGRQVVWFDVVPVSIDAATISRCISPPSTPSLQTCLLQGSSSPISVMPCDYLDHDSDFLLLALLILVLLLLCKLIWGGWGGASITLSDLRSQTSPLQPLSPCFDPLPLWKLRHMSNAPRWPDAVLFYLLWAPPNNSPKNYYFVFPITLTPSPPSLSH